MRFDDMRRAAIISAIVFPLVGWSQTLIGSGVTTAIYCCSAPIEADRITTFVSAIVGDDVEFPERSFVFFPNDPGSDVDVDIGASRLTFQPVRDTTAVPGAFNGYVFDFIGNPAIVGVSVDPASTFSPVDFSFDSNTLILNFAGVSVSETDASIVRLTLAPIPEASTAALSLVGLAAMMVAKMTRDRKRAPPKRKHSNNAARA